jgi:hypothetical protein
MKAKTPKKPTAPMTDEQKLAVAASSPLAKTLSAAVAALGALRDKAGELMDPVKKVCYPPLAAAHHHAHKQAVRVSDPIHKICYEPLKGHWERKYRSKYPKHANTLLVLDVVLVVIIAALVVAGGFSPYFLPDETPDVLAVDVTMPETVTSGVPASFDISYENLSKQALPCAVLTVHPTADLVDAGVQLAGGVAGEEADPSCGGTAVPPTAIGIPLPALAAGSLRHATLTGVPYAPAGSIIQVPATISYWETGSTQPTVVPFHVRIPVAAAASGVEVSVPERILRGSPVALTVSYHNDGSLVMPDAAVRFAPPTDFVTTGASPRATAPGVWSIGDLPAGARGTIVIHGYLRSVRERATSASFGAELAVNAGTQAPAVAAATRVNADSLSSGLTLTQEIDGADAARFLRPGDTVTVRLTARNEGETTFTDGELRFFHTEGLLAADEGRVTAWTADTLPALAKIAPGDTVVAETSVTVRSVTPSLVDALGGDTVATLSSALSARADAETVLIDTPPTDVPIATALRLQAAGIYFTKDGDQLGRGPLPPTVGEETRYRIVVQIDNLQHPVKDATFEAFLAEGVEWTGRFSITHGEAVDHFPSTRRVTWKMPEIGAFTEESGGSPGASFEVSLTPTEDMAETIPVLLTGLTVTGTDAVTGARVAARMGDITTRLPFDYDDTRSVVAGVEE